jgi:hypothetical protein
MKTFLISSATGIAGLILGFLLGLYAFYITRIKLFEMGMNDPKVLACIDAKSASGADDDRACLKTVIEACRRDKPL